MIANPRKYLYAPFQHHKKTKMTQQVLLAKRQPEALRSARTIEPPTKCRAHAAHQRGDVDDGSERTVAAGGRVRVPNDVEVIVRRAAVVAILLVQSR